eukprot:GEMP01025184.1.p1 GENE.GEMP01025184.1~~GEMP01025184.1.p1  ORF type:complete len:519 (+),score=144.66 GEMP01025184.1:46-1557(+)
MKAVAEVFELYSSDEENGTSGARLRRVKREVVKEREVMKKKDVQVVIPVPSRDFRDMLRDDEEPMLLDAVFFPVRIDRPATERMNDVALPQEPNLEADIVEQRQFIHGLVAAVEETHDAFEARTMALVHEIEASDRELDRLEGVHTDMLAQNNQCEEYTTVMSEKIREYKKKIENEKLLLREQVEFASKDFGYDAGVAFVDYRKAREEPYARLKQRQDELGRNNDEHKENSRVLERECTEFEEKSLEESRNNAEKMRVLLGQLKALFQDQEALQARVTRQCRVNQDRRCTASEANKKSVQAHKQLTHLVVVHEHQNVVIDEADKRVANYVEEKRSKTRNDVDNTQNALAADKEKCDALCAKTLHLLKEKQAQQQRALRRLERKMANTMEEWQNLRTENAPEQEIRAAKDIVDQLTRQMAHVRQDIGRTETHIAAAALDTPPTSPPEVTIHDSIFARAFSRPFEWFRSTASVDQSMDSNGLFWTVRLLSLLILFHFHSLYRFWK